MLEVSRRPRLPLALVFLSGRIDRDGLLIALDRAYDAGDLRRGDMRIVTMSADLTGTLSNADLAEIRDLVSRREDGPEPGGYTSIFVPGSDRQAVLSEIYMSLWETGAAGSGGLRPDHRMVRSIDAARTLLGELLAGPDAPVIAPELPDGCDRFRHG